MDVQASVLLRRLGLVAVPVADGTAPADGARWVAVVEADLVERGWTLSADLRSRLLGQAVTVRDRWADWLLAMADESVGADRVHAPLFRTFPDIAIDVDGLYVDRLLNHLLQGADAPCLLCGHDDAVQPLAPCGHLVCTRCFAPERFSACPICGRALTGPHPFITASTDDRALVSGPPAVVRRIGLVEDLVSMAVAERDALVGRVGALSAADRDDLRVLVETTTEVDLDWLPDRVPSRETSALLGAWALHRAMPGSPALEVLEQIEGRWTTATDVARTLWTYAGGDPGLVLPPRPRADLLPRPEGETRATDNLVRVPTLARPWRRLVLGFLDGLDLPTVAEDLARHPTVWKRIAERLHPFEHVRAHPSAAVAFAALRATRAEPSSDLGRALVAAAEAEADPIGRITLVEHPDGTLSVRARTLASLIEEAFDADDLARAIDLSGSRPGVFWRSVDRLAGRVGDDPELGERLTSVAASSAAAVAPSVLAAAAAELLGRDLTVVAAVEARETASTADGTDVPRSPDASRPVRRGPGRYRRLRASTLVDAPPIAPLTPPRPKPGTPRRTFFPKGDGLRTWTEPERRRPLPADVIGTLRSIADHQLVARAGGLDRFDVAVLDARLLSVPAPMRERAASGQLRAWPRGALVDLPPSDSLRLFLHWTEPAGLRVDLDLSCVFFDDAWSYQGHVDYTRLRMGTSAMHSGDLTSAPAPQGATEYLDLHVDRLHDVGIAWAVPIVFSYNDVPFEAMNDAFAGFSLPTAAGPTFDAGTVAQRFDLRGTARSSVPMIVDLSRRRTLWVDAALSVRGHGGNAARFGREVAHLGADLWDHFTSGTRANLFDLAAWHAVARTDRVVVLHGDGTTTNFDPPLGPDDLVRLRAAAIEGSGPDGPVEVTGQRVYAALFDTGGLPLAVDPASVALTAVGRPPDPYLTVRAGDLLADLLPGGGAQAV